MRLEKLDKLEPVVDGWLKETVGAATDSAARIRIRQALENWIAFSARKKPIANLEQHLEEFRKRIVLLAESVKLSYAGGKLVVTATGDSEITLRMLKRGTAWFDPADDPDQLIAAAILVNE